MTRTSWGLDAENEPHYTACQMLTAQQFGIKFRVN